MSTRPRLIKLPNLLSSLPSNGKHSLVRPTTYPSDSFYIVTRSKLRFSAIPSVPLPGSAVKGKEREKEVVDPFEAKGVRAHGRAWGMLFWRGKYIPPKTRSSLPDPIIRGGLKTSWLEVDQSTLSVDAREAVEDWKTKYRDTIEAREKVFEERKEKSAGLSEERREVYDKGMERRAKEREEKMKVKILY